MHLGFGLGFGTRVDLRGEDLCVLAEAVARILRHDHTAEEDGHDACLGVGGRVGVGVGVGVRVRVRVRVRIMPERL